MKIIITGVTGMVGEGVLLACMEDNSVSEILIVGRKHYELQNPKVKELLLPNFNNIANYTTQLNGYDACFYCAGISSIGVPEEKYTQITYDTTMTFAKTLFSLNSNMVFVFVTGRGTDSTEKRKVMWARVKGKTENELTHLGFKGQYNFRPALMLPTKGQKSIKTSYKILGAILKYFIPKATLTLEEVGKAMIHTVTMGYPTSILEVKDIKKLACQTQ